MILKVWDNGGESFDRYTIRIRNYYYGMSENPSHPQGFNQFIGEYPEIKEDCLGTLICSNEKHPSAYLKLPYDVRRCITARS